MKEAFSPELVKHASAESNLRKGAMIFDPFSGSGTVCLSAAQGGFKAKAVEVNPFLAFLGQTKLVSCKDESLKKLYEATKLASDSDAVTLLESFSTFTSKSGKEKWLFPFKALRAGLAGLSFVEGLDTPEAKLVKLALIGATMDCCNAYKDGKCLRYKRNWRESEASRADFFDYFDGRIRMMRDDLRSDNLDSKQCSITRGDSRKILGDMVSDPFGLILTSPPYLNSFDYSDIYRPELFIGGFVNSHEDLTNLRLQTVRSHVQVKWKAPDQSEFGLLYSKALACLIEQKSVLWDRRIPLMVQAYFEDMSTLLTEARDKSSHSCQFWIVVSTSVYAGIEIPVDLILAEMAASKGWILKQVSVVRKLRSSSQHTLRGGANSYEPVQLRESVVILEADPKWRRSRREML